MKPKGASSAGSKRIASPGLDTPALVRFVRAKLQGMADADTARGMAAYMKTTQPFFGVMNTPRRLLMREVWTRFTPPTQADWSDAITALFNAGKGGTKPAENGVTPRRDSVMRPLRWHGEREFFYIACEYAERGKTFNNARSLPLFKDLITQSGWWDVVDWVAGKMVCRAFDAAPDKVAPVMERWINDKDLWVRRAAIISQLNRKTATDQEMLGRFCLQRAHEKDFFIRKAIGWALRQHARTDPAWVRIFLAKHDHVLPRLSVREAAKHL